jgi:reactive intermediate/imine deaminase
MGNKFDTCPFVMVVIVPTSGSSIVMVGVNAALVYRIQIRNVQCPLLLFSVSPQENTKMATLLKHISTQAAPRAIGPYSQAIVANGFIYTAGQIPLIPDTMELVQGDIQAQTKQCFKNLKAVLEAANSNVDHIVKTTVFLKVHLIFIVNDMHALIKVFRT